MKIILVKPFIQTQFFSVIINIISSKMLIHFKLQKPPFKMSCVFSSSILAYLENDHFSLKKSQEFTTIFNLLYLRHLISLDIKKHNFIMLNYLT